MTLIFISCIHIIVRCCGKSAKANKIGINGLNRIYNYRRRYPKTSVSNLAIKHLGLC